MKYEKIIHENNSMKLFAQMLEEYHKENPIKPRIQNGSQKKEAHERNSRQEKIRSI